MIEAINLTKKYGSTIAINRLNFNIEKGEIFGFLGPNGAGKTTTIKIFTGLLKPTEGVAKIDGIDIQKEPVKVKKMIGLLPENPFLYEKLTGYEFLNFIADMYEVNSDKIKQKINSVLQLFELEEKSNELIQTYSKGMRQKIVLCSILIREVKVVFLDEPTHGLDPKSAKIVKDVLKELSNKGVTIFLSTHILEIAEKMCDRIGIINKGELIAIGSMDELRNKARTDVKTLEDIFLEVTGAGEEAEVAKYL